MNLAQLICRLNMPTYVKSKILGISSNCTTVQPSPLTAQIPRPTYRGIAFHFPEKCLKWIPQREPLVWGSDMQSQIFCLEICWQYIKEVLKYPDWLSSKGFHWSLWVSRTEQFFSSIWLAVLVQPSFICLDFVSKAVYLYPLTSSLGMPQIAFCICCGFSF